MCVVSFCRWGTMCSRYFSWVPGPGDFQLSPSASKIRRIRQAFQHLKIADELHRAPAPSHPGYHPDDKRKRKKNSEVFESDRRRRSFFWKPLWKWLVSNLVSSPWSPFNHSTDIQHSICTSLHVHIHARPAWSNSNTSHTFFDPSRPQYGLENPPGARHKVCYSSTGISTRNFCGAHLRTWSLRRCSAGLPKESSPLWSPAHIVQICTNSIAAYQLQEAASFHTNIDQIHPWTLLSTLYLVWVSMNQNNNLISAARFEHCVRLPTFWRLEVVVEHRSRVAQIARGKWVFPATTVTTVDTHRILTDANHPIIPLLPNLLHWLDFLEKLGFILIVSCQNL